jgi:hypothetical protein
VTDHAVDGEAASQVCRGSLELTVSAVEFGQCAESERLAVQIFQLPADEQALLELSIRVIRMAPAEVYAGQAVSAPALDVFVPKLCTDGKSSLEVGDGPLEPIAFS